MNETTSRVAQPIRIVVTGPNASGKSAIVALFQKVLRDSGFTAVKIINAEETPENLQVKLEALLESRLPLDWDIPIEIEEVFGSEANMSQMRKAMQATPIQAKRLARTLKLAETSARDVVDDIGDFSATHMVEAKYGINYVAQQALVAAYNENRHYEVRGTEFMTTAVQVQPHPEQTFKDYVTIVDLAADQARALEDTSASELYRLITCTGEVDHVKNTFGLDTRLQDYFILAYRGSHCVTLRNGEAESYDRNVPPAASNRFANYVKIIDDAKAS